MPTTWRVSLASSMRITKVSNPPIQREHSAGANRSEKNWSKLFESIPDFRAELLRIAIVGEEEWGEWIWRGTKEDGTPLEERGVTIMGVRDGQIAWGRLYLEETEREGADINVTVQRIAGREEV